MVEHADWSAVDDILALLSVTVHNTPAEKFHQIRTRYAQGMGGLQIVGDPDHVAGQLIALTNAGLTGAAVSLVNYVAELPFFCDEVLPRLERAGLREKRSVMSGDVTVSERAPALACAHGKSMMGGRVGVPAGGTCDPNAGAARQGGDPTRPLKFALTVSA